MQTIRTVSVIARNDKASHLLDLLRGIAALGVMLFHVRSFMLQDYINLHHPNVLTLVLYLATSRGYQFVMVFFVLSGLFISPAVFASVTARTFSWRKYLVNRISRLWIVLVPALILSIFIHGVLMFGYGHVTHGDFSVSTFFGNLLFLQGTFVPVFGNNDPLWSLSYEFWYYILFPCVLLTFYARTYRQKIMYAMVVIVLCIFLDYRIIEYFSVWLVGFVVSVTPRISISVLWKKLAVVAVATLLAIMSLFGDVLIEHSDYTHNLPTDFLIALAVGAMAYTWLISFGGKKSSRWFATLCQWLASFSYTLYLTHWPILHLIMVLSRGAKWYPNFVGVLHYSVVCLALFSAAWLLSLITEKHTERLRMTISQSVLRVGNTSIS